MSIDLHWIRKSGWRRSYHNQMWPHSGKKPKKLCNHITKTSYGCQMISNDRSSNVYSTWRRHQMEYFPRYWPFRRAVHSSPVNSPHNGQWRRALIFSLICAWINGWVNNREDGDLRRHRAHYDITVMWVLGVYKVIPGILWCNWMHACGQVKMQFANDFRLARTAFDKGIKCSLQIIFA